MRTLLLAMFLITAGASAADLSPEADAGFRQTCTSAVRRAAEAQKEAEASSARSQQADAAAVSLRLDYSRRVVATMNVDRVTVDEAKAAHAAPDNVLGERVQGYNGVMIRLAELQGDARKGVIRGDYDHVLGDALVYKDMHKAMKREALASWEDFIAAVPRQ